ncbi:MAG: terpene cyclase/mutase family protein [Methanimicrococcus sp.]|nr:terpene cyclase/mutase family protein [Methanimicrococcus sp.]
MTSCKVARVFKEGPSGLPAGAADAADAGFSWVSIHFSKSKDALREIGPKELSNLILSHLYWNYPQIAFLYIHTLLEKQNDNGSFGNGSFGDIRDTARAASCLFASFSILEARAKGLDNKDILAAHESAVSYLTSCKSHWGDAANDIYNTAYVLSALADAGVAQEDVCLAICNNDNPNWRHPGTTALILTALWKQKSLGQFGEKADTAVFEFISKKTNDLLFVRKDGYWSYPATSCLVLQALLLCGQKSEAGQSLSWLLAAQNDNGSWENDLNTTALALLTL